MSEYALIIALVAVALIASLVMFSDSLGAILAAPVADMTTASAGVVEAAIPAWISTGFQDIMTRMQAYYDENGHWLTGNRA